MRTTLYLFLLLLLASFAYGQCVPPLIDANGAMVPDFFNCANYANSPLPVVDPTTGAVSGGIRKFVDTLPGLTPGGANNLGQYIPVAVPDITTYPGSDYYEIAVVQYQQKMHSDLPPTTLRGYVQLSTSVVPGSQISLSYFDGSPILLPDGSPARAVDNPHYLGPLIVATKNRAVRILFRNLLPTGAGGNLFIPVDTTNMGAGMGPGMMGMADPPPYPMCGMEPKPADCYKENRATLHLHGGLTPWISDGTPHQWTTPANENTPYPKGVSVSNVPDMPDPGPGALTFFYTNQQSARLMFYHDHAWGITRLNVYAGEAAGYLLTDSMEQSLIGPGGPLAGLGTGIPLIIQDKTFVPADVVPFTNLGATYQSQLAAQDPTWDLSKWGGAGQLWAPHVYMPAQNPNDLSGANAFGRWAYGPWFWPPQNYTYGPRPNPYFDPNCDADVVGWCQPPEVPGVPYLSMGMEAFNDTPMVNGTAYPTVTLQPRAYRFRILNAANDRFFNLQWYVADATGKEVALKSAEVAAAQVDPNVFPTPDTAISPVGPNWIQMGTEGGFLPAPVVVPNQPITWVTDPTVFNAGNVKDHALLLGPAERADVVVDLSAFGGKTLILYNDSPAAFPARDPRYDYYTGSPDLTDTGGAPPTLPGYGPNTRTVMQVQVAGGSGPGFDLAALQAAFAHHLDTNNNPAGVFEASQDPIIVGQSAYNSAYGTTFRSTAPRDGFARITNFSLTFDTLSGTPLTNFPFQNKALHDEMNGSFDPVFGRMSGNLGLEAPLKPNGQNVILYPYVNPVSEVLKGVELPFGSLNVTPINSMDDGTQIWKITHNGVDTHPIHFHLFNVQLLNRVGWDGVIRKPDLNELGWKDTIRVSPLEDTIVALRPIIPKNPFGVPDSLRPLNPMMPIGDTSMFVNIGADGNPLGQPIVNEVVNFGWEYVWHCHILSHEEMDMMRPMSAIVSRSLSPAPVVSYTRNGGITLTWLDGTPANYSDPTTWGDPRNEIGFRIERADVVNGAVGAYTVLGTVLANQTTFTDNAADPTATYNYVVVAFNAAGNSPSAPLLVGVPAAAVAPAALSFGDQVVNTTSPAQTVTLSNPGTAGLTINSIGVGGPSASDFVVGANTCGSSLAAGANCTITIAFTPTASGARSASLDIGVAAPAASQSVLLNGTGTQSIAGIVPTALDFGAQEIDTTGTAQGVTLSNGGTAGLAITSITITGPNATDFAISANGCGAGLAAGSNCALNLTFTPAAAGPRAASLEVRSSDPTNPLLSVSLSGTGTIKTQVLLVPSSLAFPDQLVGTRSAAQGVTLTNVGPTVLSIGGVTITGANAGEFTSGFATNCGATLAAGRSCVVNVRFRPIATGSRTAAITITDSDPTSPQTVALTGVGVAPNVAVSPTAIDFSTPLNVPSAAQLMNVTNTGTAALTINRIALGGANPGQFSQTNNCPGSLPIGGSCTVSVVFTPTNVGTGTKSATLNVNVAAPATQASVALNGVIAVPAFVVAPAAAPFGAQAPRTASAPQVIAVSNTGAAPLTINNVVLRGTNPNQFALVNGCPATLAAGANCTISVTFRPLSLGTKDATLNVNVAAPATAQSVGLTGIGQ